MQLCSTGHLPAKHLRNALPVPQTEFYLIGGYRDEDVQEFIAPGAEIRLRLTRWPGIIICMFAEAKKKHKPLRGESTRFRPVSHVRRRLAAAG
jgi:hypothetical protein